VAVNEGVFILFDSAMRQSVPAINNEIAKLGLPLPFAIEGMVPEFLIMNPKIDAATKTIRSYMRFGASTRLQTVINGSIKLADAIFVAGDGAVSLSPEGVSFDRLQWKAGNATKSGPLRPDWAAKLSALISLKSKSLLEPMLRSRYNEIAKASAPLS
jgi:hypothetical protein